MASYVPNQHCPHCGGIHWGQRFDDCPYVKMLADKLDNTPEARKNCEEFVRRFREEMLALGIKPFGQDKEEECRHYSDN